MNEKQTGKFKQFCWKLKLWYMDYQWKLRGRHVNKLFPPSFYYTHTSEEIQQITKETTESLRKLIDEIFD